MTLGARPLASLALAGLVAAWSASASYSTEKPLVGADGNAVAAALRRDLREARAGGDPGKVCDALSKLALARIDVGELQGAEENANEALALAGGMGDRVREAEARDALGDSWYYREDFERALAEYRAAQRIFLDRNDAVEAARRLKSIGIAYHDLGRWEEAADALESAARTLQATPWIEETASSLENLGRVYLSLGDSVRAYSALREAVVLARRTGKTRPLAHSLLRYSTVYLETGFYERALPLLREALPMFERLDARLEHAWTLSLIAECQFRLGRVDEAIATETEVVATGPGGSDIGAARRLGRLASFYVDRDPALAREQFERARALFERARYPVGWWIDAGAARAEAALGELDLAAEAYDRAIAALESERGRLGSERYRVSYFRRGQPVYRELVEVLWRRGNSGERAFAASERAKGRSLVEAIRESRSGSDPTSDPTSDPELTLREREIHGRIAELERLLLDPGVSGGAREQILQQVDQKEAELALVVSEMRRRDPRSASLLYPEPVSADRARSLIEPGTALLTYFEGIDHVFAFLVTEKDLRFVRLDAPPLVVTARVRNYLELLALEDGAASRAVGRRLYADLVAPLERLVPEEVRDLVIAPDGALSFLPFEALLDGDRFLLERWNVAYVPSATVLDEIRAQAAQGGGRDRADLLMFANPAPPEAFRSDAGAPEGGTTRALYESEGLSIPPIPYSGVEARFVRRLVDHRSRVYVGAEATEGRVKQEALARFHVVHFATHGFVSQRWPARSALLLAAGPEEAEDGLLTVPEICRLRFASDLVVLSACRSAHGPVFAGEGVQGLSRAFLHAGSRAVLASLWDVDDDRTAVLMSRFYEELEAGRSKTEALRAAKLAMLRDASTAAPRYWAGFILSGDATGAIPLAGRAWWRIGWVWAGAAAICVILLTLVWLRRGGGPVRPIRRLANYFLV